MLSPYTVRIQWLLAAPTECPPPEAIPILTRPQPTPKLSDRRLKEHTNATLLLFHSPCVSQMTHSTLHSSGIKFMSYYGLIYIFEKVLRFWVLPANPTNTQPLVH